MTYIVGDAKDRLTARIESYCKAPRSYAQIVAHSRVTPTQTRYLLRALILASRIVKEGSREGTVYVARKADAR